MEKDKKKFEEILKLNLLDQAKRVQKSVQGFYKQIAIYYILVFLTIFVNWYIGAFDQAPLFSAELLVFFVLILIKVSQWERRISNYKKNSLIEILKLYDEVISFYQGAIDDWENVIDETPKETSWLGRKLSRMRIILQKAREERSQVVEIYEKLFWQNSSNVLRYFLDHYYFFLRSFFEIKKERSQIFLSFFLFI